MFKGSMPALVTPFTPDGELDLPALEKLVEWHIAEGTHGLVPVGTTGESPSRSHVGHRTVVEGVIPEDDTLASGRYPIARALYVYFKKAHGGVIPGLKGYIAAYTSEEALGEAGYLADKGLVAAPKATREKTRKSATALETIRSL